MSKKSKGLCPFCQEQIQAKVIEENYLRRDRCICPECQEDIYVCRSPGCNNYAKGGKYYDDELCPTCTESIAENLKSTVVNGLLALGVTAIAALFKKGNE